LRFEDAGLDEILDEAEEEQQEHQQFQDAINASKPDPQPDASPRQTAQVEEQTTTLPEHAPVSDYGILRTLDGEIAGDEFLSDALNYQILLGKIDGLLESLKLDA